MRAKRVSLTEPRRRPAPTAPSMRAKCAPPSQGSRANNVGRTTRECTIRRGCKRCSRLAVRQAGSDAIGYFRDSHLVMTIASPKPTRKMTMAIVSRSCFTSDHGEDSGEESRRELFGRVQHGFQLIDFRLLTANESDGVAALACRSTLYSRRRMSSAVSRREPRAWLSMRLSESLGLDCKS